MDNSLLIENIKRICKSKGIAPTNACEGSGVGKSFISDMKRGRTPSVSKVKMLADYLDVTTSKLLGEEFELNAPYGFLERTGVFSNWEDIWAYRDQIYEQLRTVIPPTMNVDVFDKERYLIAALDMVINYDLDEMKFARWIGYNTKKISFSEYGKLDNIEYSTPFKQRLIHFHYGRGLSSENLEIAMRKIDAMLGENKKPPVSEDNEQFAPAGVCEGTRLAMELLSRLNPENHEKALDHLEYLLAKQADAEGKK